MAKQVQVGKKQQQQIVKLLQSMDGKFNRWEIWQDFILMMATSIANRFQDPHWQEREETYLKAVKKYSKKELGTFAEMCAYVVEGDGPGSETGFFWEASSWRWSLEVTGKGNSLHRITSAR